MSVELSKKKGMLSGVKIQRKPHRKSHTEFDVKRNLPKQEDGNPIRRLPRRTLKDESLGCEFGEISYRKGPVPSEKSSQLPPRDKRKPSVDAHSDKENFHPNILREPSKTKTKCKKKVEHPFDNYQSLRHTVEVIRSELQQLHTHTLTMEQQNRVLHKEIREVEQA